MSKSFLKQLNTDKQDLEDALLEQNGIVANAQASVLKLVGAITYVAKLIEHVEEQKKPKDGGGEYASTS